MHIPFALFLAQYALAHPPPSPRQATAPATYTSNPSIGGGANFVAESAHFRVYGTGVSAGDAAKNLKVMEAAHQCFVVEQGWRTPGTFHLCPPTLFDPEQLTDECQASLRKQVA